MPVASAESGSVRLKCQDLSGRFRRGPQMEKQKQPAPEAISHVRALMDALNDHKNEFWTPKLNAAFNAAEKFLKKGKAS